MRAQSSTAKRLAFSWPPLSEWWTPATTGWAVTNESAHRACVGIAAEWQAFVGRRFNEDSHLLRELFAAKAPDEAWNAWSRFWQKAADDYSAEYFAIAKLAVGFIPDGVGMDVATTNAPARATQSKAA